MSVCTQYHESSADGFLQAWELVVVLYSVFGHVAIGLPNPFTSDGSITPSVTPTHSTFRSEYGNHLMDLSWSVNRTGPGTLPC